MRGKDRRDERRQLLVDDVRRLAGLADFAIGEARLLDAPVPEDVARCAVTWRSWYSTLQVWINGNAE
jgi:hypothetical protein